MLGLSWDNGKYNGNYQLGFRALGFRGLKNDQYYGSVFLV